METPQPNPKIPLLQRWSVPKSVRDISSVLGFANFHSEYIPYFEFRVMRLREICTQPYEKESTTDDWDNIATNKFMDIKKAILTEPVLQSIDRTKRQYLLTDFCASGFGFIVLQPGNDAASLEAILKLRMELMMWAFKITHNYSKWVQDADWASRTNQTFHIDPLAAEI